MAMECGRETFSFSSRYFASEILREVEQMMLILLVISAETYWGISQKPAGSALMDEEPDAEPEGGRFRKVSVALLTEDTFRAFEYCSKRNEFVSVSISSEKRDSSTRK